MTQTPGTLSAASIECLTQLVQLLEDLDDCLDDDGLRHELPSLVLQAIGRIQHAEDRQYRIVPVGDAS